MSLSEARKLLIKKLEARTLEIYRANPQNAKIKSLPESQTLFELMEYKARLANKEAREQKPLWSPRLNEFPKEHSISQIWVTRQAYELIQNQPENPQIKDVVDKAVRFSIHNTFYPEKEKISPSFSKPDCISTGFHTSKLMVDVKWEKGKLKNRIILVRAFPLDDDSRFFRPDRWHILLKRCLPFSAV